MVLLVKSASMYTQSNQDISNMVQCFSIYAILSILIVKNDGFPRNLTKKPTSEYRT